MDTNEVTLALEIAQVAAREAGDVLNSWQERFTISEKGLFDLVTEADVAAQRAIQDKISQTFPEHEFLGEETASAKQEELIRTKKPLWVVDPLDGTTNYIHKHPCYAVSIALVEDGIPLVGVIYDPSRDELFSAAKGNGAYLNGMKMQVSNVRGLEHALLAVGFPANWRGNEQVVAAWEWFGYVSQGMRRTGSSALNLAYVAAGRLDAFFAFQQSPWDVAAGMLLVEEAGGRVTHFEGVRYSALSGGSIAASNGDLHEEVLQGLRASSLTSAPSA